MFHFVEDREIWTGLPEKKAFQFEKKELIDSWLPLPILHVAIVGLEKVRKVCEGEKMVYSLPGTGSYVTFVPIDGKLIEINSSYVKNVERVSCLELIDAFIGFAEEVRELLEYKLPELKNHPNLGPWLSRNSL